MTPLIFIHHGASAYLPYSLNVAGLRNPERPIILLGNKTNAHLAGRRTRFVNFENLLPRKERLHFESVFRPLAGTRHGKHAWIKFVFLRFFYLLEYWNTLESEHIWTFDSDTFVLEDLCELELPLKSYDCTEQCNGMCMNGLLSSRKTLLSFLECILALYESPSFLAEEEERLSKEPFHAFTEMKAYAVWKERVHPNTFHLGQELQGAIFDDCICQEHGMEMYAAQEAGKICKKPYLHPSGHLYVYSLEKSRFLLLRSLNLSWVPQHFFVKISKILGKFSERFPAPLHPRREELSVLRLKPGLLDALYFRYSRSREFVLGKKNGFSE